MPPRRRGGSHRRQKAPESAMSTCNLPATVVADILSRLPVKTLMRFRCVCKPWTTLFANPKFIAAHHDRTKDDDHHTLLLHSRHAASRNQTISLLHTKSPDSPLNLHHPFPPPFLWPFMEVVGSINGLVCLNSPPISPLITLWNPATKQYRHLPYPIFTKFNTATLDKVSIGFAFDSVKNDYKVIRVVCFERETGIGTRAEVFSTNAGTWRKIDVDLPYRFCDTECLEVVKGVPYWNVKAHDEDSRVLGLWFDVGNEAFRPLELPHEAVHRSTRGLPVNYKDSLAFLAYSVRAVTFYVDGIEGMDGRIEGKFYTPIGDGDKWVDVWVMDEGNGSWSKKFTVGPIAGVERVVGCSKNGEIVAENSEGKLLVYDAETGEVKDVGISGAVARSFGVRSYSESLVSIKGTVQVGELDERFVTQFDRKDRKNRYRS